jgi:hypothetical protein
MESLRKLIALAGFIACLTVSVKAQDFNKTTQESNPQKRICTGNSSSRWSFAKSAYCTTSDGYCIPLALIGVLIYVG